MPTQEDLIEFVEDPATISAAVEGSMERRLGGMPTQTNPEAKENE